MYYDFAHNPGDRVIVTAIPHAGDAHYNGATGIVVGHDLDWDDDRTWPNVLVQLDGYEQPARILDYNLTYIDPLEG